MIHNSSFSGGAKCGIYCYEQLPPTKQKLALKGKGVAVANALHPRRLEIWYLDWLQDCINAIPEAKYNVEIKSQIQQSALKFAKKVNPIAEPSATHICDYESNDEYHVKKFKGILDELSRSNKIVGRSFKYELGYSNYTFELWMILHKMDYGGSLADRTQYLKPINKAYGMSFESLDKYKSEKTLSIILNSCLFQMSATLFADRNGLWRLITKMV